MNQYAAEDEEMIHIDYRPGSDILWVCQQENCDGEHHFYVRANAH